MGKSVVYGEDCWNDGFLLARHITLLLESHNTLADTICVSLPLCLGLFHSFESNYNTTSSLLIIFTSALLLSCGPLFLSNESSALFIVISSTITQVVQTDSSRALQHYYLEVGVYGRFLRRGHKNRPEGQGFQRISPSSPGRSFESCRLAKSPCWTDATKLYSSIARNAVNDP